MDVPNVPVSEPVEPSTGARTASASQHNTRLRRRTRESGASTAVDDAQHEKSALAPASDALPVTDRENPPEGRVAWDTTRPGGTRASVEIPTRPSPSVRKFGESLAAVPRRAWPWPWAVWPVLI